MSDAMIVPNAVPMTNTMVATTSRSGPTERSSSSMRRPNSLLPVRSSGGAASASGLAPRPQLVADLTQERDLLGVGGGDRRSLEPVVRPHDEEDGERDDDEVQHR